MPSPTNLKQIQQIEFEMLKQLKEVCIKNRIPFFLAQGTLLGAVRHRGFIPWDDDADVLIPAEEIPRLMECFPKETDGSAVIVNHTTNPYYPSTWTKIRKNHTTSMPVAYKKLPIHWGICIDLFPFYGVSDHLLLQKAEILLFKFARKLLMASITPYDEYRSIATRFTEHISLKIRHALAQGLLHIFSRHAGKETNKIYVTCKGGQVMPRSYIYGETKSLTFENESFPVPAKTHEFLTQMFGDYMTPPPKDEQGGHSLRMGNIIWDCENGYETYL